MIGFRALRLALTLVCTSCAHHPVASFAPIRASSRSVQNQRLYSSSNEDEVPIRAAVFQAHEKHLDNKAGNPLAVLTQVADSLRVASLHGVDIVVFPELFLSGGSGSKQNALDRESSELNIVGNIAGDLNVACVIGYAESMSEMESRIRDTGEGAKNGCYNSIAAFHNDGSRAGNHRSISTGSDFNTGIPFVESIPVGIRLQSGRKEVKVGLMCGSDVMSPEHCRNLARSGARILIAATTFGSNSHDANAVKFLPPARAMENEVPFLFANVGGSSAVIAPDGNFLVCAPKDDGDMPTDCGYLIPCEHGALYAADIELNPASSALRESIIEQWDVNPRVPDELAGGRSEKKFKGFGQGRSKK